MKKLKLLLVFEGAVKLECDFILRDSDQIILMYKLRIQLILVNKLKREYRPLEMIRDNYAKYVVTTDYLLQKINRINHINILEFIKAGKKFEI